jgi:hypothetical protein
MLPIGHVPTQIYVNKTYIPHYNLAIIYIYFVEYILLRYLQNNETARQKGVHDYVVNTLNVFCTGI